VITRCTNSMFPKNLLIKLKNKCMVIYELCGAPSRIKKSLDKVDFAHIPKYQNDATKNAWSLEQCVVPLH
jgi:hypothetical protein